VPKVVKTAKKISKPKKKNVNRAEPEEPIPLPMIPPSNEVAPHLPKDVLEGIGDGFLQIEPMAISATLLEVDDIDE
jgi:hypothetical protein